MTKTIHIGFDIGGTDIKGGHTHNQEQNFFRLPSPKKIQDATEIVSKKIQEVLSLGEVEKINIGIAITGIVVNNILEVSKNFSVYAPYDILTELRGMIGGEIDMYTKLINDADAAALAEANKRGISTATMLTFGTSVGCGIIQNSEIQTGDDGRISEVGYRIPFPDKPDIIFRTLLHSKNLQSLTETEDGRDLEKKLKAGNIKTIKGFQTYSEYITLLLEQLYQEHGTREFIVGGGSAKAVNNDNQSFLTSYVREQLSKKDLDFTIYTATLANNAGVIGAIQSVQ